VCKRTRPGQDGPRRRNRRHGVEGRKTDDTAKTKQNTEGGTPNPKTPPHIIKMNSELCKMAVA
jgi:hypothetical protein